MKVGIFRRQEMFQPDCRFFRLAERPRLPTMSAHKKPGFLAGITICRTVDRGTTPDNDPV
jgi:hypothetical protein